MKEVLNKTRRPIKVPLPGGKVLHLGPGKSGQVSDQAVDSPAFKKLLKEKVIELAEGSDAHGAGGPASSSGGHESTQGHRPPTVVLPKGNR